MKQSTGVGGSNPSTGAVIVTHQLLLCFLSVTLFGLIRLSNSYLRRSPELTGVPATNMALGPLSRGSGTLAKCQIVGLISEFGERMARTAEWKANERR